LLLLAFFWYSFSLSSWILAQFERTRLVNFEKPGRVVTCLEGGATAKRVGGKGGRGRRSGEG